VARRDVWKFVVAGVASAPFLFAVAPALLIPVGLFVFCKLPEARAALQRTSHRDLVAMAWQHKVVIVPALLLSFCVVLYKYADIWASSPRLLVLIQVVSGNWSRDLGSVVTPLTLTFYAALAIALNVLPWLYLIRQVWKLLAKDKERSMVLLQGVTAFEGMAKQSLYDLFPGDEKKAEQIDSAFEKAKQELVPHLTAIFGQDATERYLAALRQDVRRIPKPE
jgi:hypothetical protein